MLNLSQNGVHIMEVTNGSMELFVDLPRNKPLGAVIVGHPQPLLGGSATHKVPHFLSRSLKDAGWMVIRPNFRGVGQSTGTHDGGQGESKDVIQLVQNIKNYQPELNISLLGFSFGAYVMACVARQMADCGTPAWRVCLVSMPFGEVESGRHYATPDDIPHALVVHGEVDTQVPLKSLLDWARPKSQAVTVIPGCDHFFNGHLHQLRSLILTHLR